MLHHGSILTRIFILRPWQELGLLARFITSNTLLKLAELHNQIITILSLNTKNLDVFLNLYFYSIFKD